MIFDIVDIEEKIRYSFKNKELLIKAFTHSSYANEKAVSSNENLEFLGDSILGLVVAEILFKKYPDKNEGFMTTNKSDIVRAETLYKAANDLDITRHILLGAGEKNSRPDAHKNIYSDAFEALIAAIYLDGGMVRAKQFIEYALNSSINGVKSDKRIVKAVAENNIADNNDYKSQLQEYVQKNNLGKIDYIMLEKKGPEHEPIFTYNVKIDGRICGQGIGKSVKTAQQDSAKEALKRMQKLPQNRVNKAQKNVVTNINKTKKTKKNAGHKDE